MTLTIFPISDIHLEYMPDAGLAFYRQLMQVQADVCVVAGDLVPLCDLRYLEVAEQAFNALTTRFEHVIYVLGNHEYYRGSQEQMVEVCKVLEATFPNLYILERQTVTIAGVTFAGATLWFPHTPGNRDFYPDLDDFRLIARFREWVYDENAAATAFFAASDADVWVLHYLPSMQSVPSFFKQKKNSALNRFFVSDLTAPIAAQKPKLVLHGHTHGSCDYKLGSTRVLCHPHGYNDRKNRKFSYDTRVEV